jgi:hypothetical protein
LTPRSALIPVFSLTLLLSAFLLFLVQPMFGKMILPLLGGAPAVWNTALLFFQCVLLGGYAYAHALARLRPGVQAALHVPLLILCGAALPIAVPAGWTPPVTGDPVFWQLAMMAVAAGGPFFILSASAPLLQHWFSRTGHAEAENPYFLYAASNAGSMAALLLYPFAIEPHLALAAQARLWSAGYWLLLLLAAACAVLAAAAGRAAVPAPAPAPEEEGGAAAGEGAPTWRRRLSWLLLAFVPSSLMLGVTTFITTDLAAVPLLWVLPLSLYVLTFIIAFSRKPPIERRETEMLQGVVMIFMLGLLGSYLSLSMPFLMALHLALFFLTALMCHQELAALRPPARHLTQFYLILSLGGALGGAFNALAAPHLFRIPAEYGIVLALAAFMRLAASSEQSLARALEKLAEARRHGARAFLRASGLPFIVLVFAACLATVLLILHTPAQWIGMIVLVWTLPALLRRRFAFAACALVVIAFHPPGIVWSGLQKSTVIARERNFFGILRVADKPDGTRALIHGTTLHGLQPRAPEYRLTPISYYSERSGIADAFALLDAYKGEQNIGVLGLGVGATACYARPRRHFDFFEIDPAVIAIAQNPDYFTYLRDCGSSYAILPGDARLTIARQPDARYDMLLLDAFSSDNIPVHLLTAEAMRIYKSKLSARGILIAHISNQFLNLRPVVAAAAREIGMKSYDRIVTGGRLPGSNLPYNATDYVLLTRDAAQGKALEQRGWKEISPEPAVAPWTDQFSNIVSVLRIGRGGTLALPPAP